MSLAHIVYAAILLLTIGVGMIRIIKGPTAADRMLAAQLFGTCGVAIILLLAKGLGETLLTDIGLAFALLAPLSTITFIRRAWQKSTSASQEDDQANQHT